MHVAKQVFVGSWFFKLAEKSNANFWKEAELVQNFLEFQKIEGLKNQG